MVNRSRNMRRNRSRSRGRRMRGGELTQEQIDAAANNQKEGETMPSVENSGYLSSITNAATDLTKKASDLTNGLEGTLTGFSDKATGALSGFSDTVSGFLPGPGATEPAQTPAQIPAQTQVAAPPTSWWGGSKRSRQMRMKGGKGLGLDYYATSVNGIKVAQPTYMEYYKGGKRSSKRRTKRRRRTCKRRMTKRSRRRHRRR